MYRDMNDIIREFWESSLKNDFSQFDWQEAFDNFLSFLHANNVEHGLCSFEEYLENHEALYGNLDEDVELSGQFHWEYIGFSGYDALEGALRAKYKAGKEYFERDGTHSELLELEKRVDDWQELTEPQMIQLFDECIHAEHCNGSILDDVDVDDLRQEVEDEREAHVTNMRDFL